MGDRERYDTDHQVGRFDANYADAKPAVTVRPDELVRQREFERLVALRSTLELMEEPSADPCILKGLKAGSDHESRQWNTAGAGSL